MRNNTISASRYVYFGVMILSVMILAVYLLRVPLNEVRVRACYHLWIDYGMGHYNGDYYGPLCRDDSRDKRIEGMTLDHLRQRLGQLVDGDVYNDSNSYRGEALRSRRNVYKDKDANRLYRLYWLNKPDGFGWAIEVVNGKARGFLLFKG